MNKTLYIYRASAGSGKTFTLALEYIKLLIATPSAYKHILAVTFTNKATAEMKERILSCLYGIANALPSSDDYMKRLCEEFPKLDAKSIRHRADTALKMILHDYTHFKIQTIDAFFQMVLRGLAKELELSGDMEITLDSQQLLKDSVDLLIKRLTPTSVEMGWLVEYIEEHLANDKSWKVRETIKTFAENIIKEEYQERGDTLRKQIEDNNGATLADYKNAVRKIERDIVERIKAIGERFFAIADANDLSMNDFAGKSRGLWGFFEKVQKGNLVEITEKSVMQKCIDAPEKVSERLSLAQCEEIATLIATQKAMYEKELHILNSCELSLARFHQLRLLNSIARTLQEENNKENRFLLAQTTYLLSRMINDSSTFIFEKIGSEISHIFIDEFQDTSKLQWQCFKVLLSEVMAHGTKNLIVGDVKQSIYRWRNSDWNILNHIENEFQEASVANYSKEAGTTNFRSERRVIEFNNALFTKATEVIRSNYYDKLGSRLEDLEKAYSDVAQNIPAKRDNKGYASIKMIKAGENGIKESMQQEIMETLEELLLNRNVRPGDITILIREKKYIEDIARLFNEKFADKGFSIVSDEAYKLSSSQAVKLLMSALRYLTVPEDKVNIIYLITAYNKFILKQELPADSFLQVGNHESLLPQTLTDKIESLKELPLYELIEQLVKTLKLNSINGSEAYIYSFLDYVSHYIDKGVSDTKEFIKVWNDELCDKTIPSGETDSVRIMTIHKSKGLEFHTVLLPFATWKLTGETHSAYKEKILWCHTEEEPFGMLDLLPVEFSGKMQNSIYTKEFNNEYLFQLVDNLNLLYVACTRASKNLFVFSESDSKKDYIGQLLAKVSEELALEGSAYDKEKQLFTYGEILPSIEKEVKSENPFTVKPQSESTRLFSYENRLTFRQSRNLTRFLTKDKAEEERLEYLILGEIMHNLLSKIVTGDELEREMKKMQMEGLISTQEEFKHIENIIRRAIKHPKGKEWFSGKYRLFNECTILFRQGEKHQQRRPDRVMVYGNEATVVDFKFGRENEEYIKQVQEYVRLLLQMGYENVKGYLWYIYSNKIIEI